MEVGVQIVDMIPANTSIDYFTYGWDPAWDVAWTVVPTSPAPGQPQVEWSVAVERATNTSVTYYVTITNLTSGDVGIEGRYAILNI